MIKFLKKKQKPIEGEWYKLKKIGQYIRVIEVFDLRDFFMVKAFVLPTCKIAIDIFPKFEDVELVENGVEKNQLDMALLNISNKIKKDNYIKFNKIKKDNYIKMKELLKQKKA